MLSIRPDVLPPAVMRELAKLQDDIEPFPTEDARRLIEAELGQPISAVFSDFSEEPIAAASLAQVDYTSLRHATCCRPSASFNRVCMNCFGC